MAPAAQAFYLTRRRMGGFTPLHSGAHVRENSPTPRLPLVCSSTAHNITSEESCSTNWQFTTGVVVSCCSHHKNKHPQHVYLMFKLLHITQHEKKNLFIPRTVIVNKCIISNIKNKSFNRICTTDK